MEPDQTHSAPLPQQELTHPAGGCPTGPQPEDLMQGGDVGANPPPGQRVALDDKVITRLEVYEFFLKKSKEKSPRMRPNDIDPKERVEMFITAFEDRLGPFSADYLIKLNSLLTKFISKCEDLYKKSSYNKKHFLKKNGIWLEKTFTAASDSAIVQVDSNSPRTNKFLKLSDRQQLRSKRELEYILEDEPPGKLIKCFSKVITKNTTDAKNVEFIIDSCTDAPSTSSEISEIKKKITTEQQPCTPEEALALVIDRKFTKETYINLRQFLNKKGYSGFPPYSQVQDAKNHCHPPRLLVNEVEAHIPLESLLSHTYNRILQLCDEVFSEYCQRNNIGELKCTFSGSWGFDGSTGQALYKQKISQSDSELDNENSLFATTFIPLKIETENKHVIWLNPAPQSYRSCRPIHIQYRKETTELILSEQKWIEDQIKCLQPLVAYTSRGHKITAECDLHLTIIDGKVLNVITRTSSQLRCPYCKVTSIEFNNLDVVYSKPTQKELLKFGLSPMHAFIRVLEFLLRLSYKNDPAVHGVYRVRKESQESAIIAERKHRIQTEIRRRLGLLVDVVKPNAGTTNDGNTARKLLSDKNRDVFAEILGIDLWLLEDLHTILVALNCGLPLDPHKFGQFCKNIAQRYVQTYPWHRMTVTLHKILVHGEEIIENSTLPMGLLSEQAGETRNKFYKYDREHHCRKSDRIKTITDLFNRALESSDPVISNIRLRERQTNLKKLPLPGAVISLLKAPVISQTQVNEMDDGEIYDENILENIDDEEAEVLAEEDSE